MFQSLQDGLAGAFKSISGKGKLTGCHHVILAKNGRKIPIRLDATTIYSGEKELATIGYFRDLSEDIRLQPEAQEKDLKQASLLRVITLKG